MARPCAVHASPPPDLGLIPDSIRSTRWTPERQSGRGQLHEITNVNETVEGEEHEPLPHLPEPEYPSMARFACIFFSLVLCMFSISLDLTITPIAIPRITDHFGSVKYIGWYGAAYFLTLASFQSFWNKAYTYCDLRWTFLIAIGIFELGTLISAVARNSASLIVGRALAGLGTAGITGGCYVIIALIVQPERVRVYISSINAVFSLAIFAGPLLGGFFIEKISWHWCFYTNLIVSGFAFMAFFYILETPNHAIPPRELKREILHQMNPIGIALIMASLICYNFALNMAGVSRPWGSSLIVGLLSGWLAMASTFTTATVFQKDRALIVLRLFETRLVATSCMFIFFLNAAYFLLMYYLPIYFQAVRGLPPMKSGLHNLPLILTASIFTLLSSQATRYIKYYKLFLLVGSALLATGSVFIYSLDINSSPAKYIGYQILAGAGVGIAIHIPLTATQASVTTADVPLMTTTVLFFQLLSGTMGISAAQAIFTNRMLVTLHRLAPQLDPALVLATGATSWRSAFTDPAEQAAILASYMAGMHTVFALGIGLAVVAVGVGFLAPFEKMRDIAVVLGAVA